MTDLPPHPDWIFYCPKCGSEIVITKSYRIKKHVDHRTEEGCVNSGRRIPAKMIRDLQRQEGI